MTLCIKVDGPADFFLPLRKPHLFLAQGVQESPWDALGLRMILLSILCEPVHSRHLLP